MVLGRETWPDDPQETGYYDKNMGGAEMDYEPSELKRRLFNSMKRHALMNLRLNNPKFSFGGNLNKKLITKADNDLKIPYKSNLLYIQDRGGGSKIIHRVYPTNDTEYFDRVYSTDFDGPTNYYDYNGTSDKDFNYSNYDYSNTNNVSPYADDPNFKLAYPIQNGTYPNGTTRYDDGYTTSPSDLLKNLNIDYFKKVDLDERGILRHISRYGKRL